MAVVYSNNFDSDTVGQLPPGWANLTGTAWVVGTNAPVSSPNSFGANVNNNVAAYNQAVALLANSFIQYEFIKPAGGYSPPGPALRVNSGYTAGYVILPTFASDNTGNAQLYKRASGYWSVIGSAVSITIAGSPVAGDAINVQFKANGSTLTLTAWKKGTTQPTSGTGFITWTNSDVSAAGYPGLYNVSTANPPADNVVIDNLLAAESYDVTGPSGGVVGVASTNFTITVTGTIASTIFTPNDNSGGGTFTPSTVTLVGTNPTGTFTYTPASAGAKTITVTNNGGITVPASDTYTATGVATSYTLTGPSGGLVGSQSTNFTITISGTTTSSTIFTPSDSGEGGTFTPTTVTIAAGENGTGTFTYTPASAGAKTISTSDNGGLTDPSPITYTAIAGAQTIPVTDSSLLWAPGAWDDIAVGTYGVSTRSRQSANTGSYLKFQAAGSTGVSLLIDSSISSGIDSGNRPSVTYSVDSGARVTVQIAAQTEIAMLTGAASATRTFEVWTTQRENSGEANGGTRFSTTAGTSLTNGVRITGVSINDGATMASFPRVKSKSLICWGDSITEGVMAGTGWANMVVQTSNNDPLSAWPQVLAEILKCEYLQCGFGAQGWIYGGSAGAGASFPVTWDSFSIDRPRTMSGFDYAVCLQGTNDGMSNPTVATLSAAWLAEARAALGADCWIFLVIPPGGFVASNLTTGINTYLAANPGDTKTKLLDMSTTISREWFDNDGATIYSADGVHPTAVGHALIAGAIGNLINAQIGGTVIGGESSYGYFG